MNTSLGGLHLQPPVKSDHLSAPRRPFLLLSPCSFLSNVSDAGVARIADGCRELTSINLTYCKNVAGVGLEQLAKRCSKLTDITFVYCGSVSDAGLESIAKVSRRGIKKPKKPLFKKV